MNLGKVLANQLAEDRVLVNTICPVPVHSVFWNMHVGLVVEHRSIRLDEAWREVEGAESLEIPLGSYRPAGMLPIWSPCSLFPLRCERSCLLVYQRLDLTAKYRTFFAV